MHHPARVPPPHRPAGDDRPSSPLRIGVAAFASDGGRSGIGQYLLNVVAAMARLAPADEFVVFAPSRDRELWRHAPPNLRLVLERDAWDRPLASLAWHATALRARLRRERCDVVFLPAANRRLGLAYGVPSVATVHDLSQLHVAGKYDAVRMLHARRVVPALVRGHDLVLTPSDSTRVDVLAHTGLPPERVRTVANGCDLRRFLAARAPQTRPDGRGYLLYVARLEHPGKNHVALLRAYAQLRAAGCRQRLVFAGPRWSGAEAIDREIARLGLSEHVEITGFVPNEALPGLYAGADLFVFPSLYEGFGIPLLEAMAAGVPGCASRTSSLPEVGGDAVLYFDPRDPSAIAATIRALLADDLLRARLRAAGRARAAAYTWERTAAGVLAALRAVAGR